MNTTVRPPDQDSKLYESNGRLYMYVGRVVANGDDRTIVPCRGMNDRELRMLFRVATTWPPEPKHWRRHGADLWKTHVSVRVNVDRTIAKLAQEQRPHGIDGRGTR